MPLDYIVRIGEPATEMFFIKSGIVDVKIGDKIIASIKAGMHFGEKALLEKSKRIADIRAVTFCVVSVLSRDSIQKVYIEFPELKYKMREGLSLKYLNKDKTIKILRLYPLFSN